MGRVRGTRAGVGAAQAALAVVVVAGVALGALALRPGGGGFSRGRGPLGGSSALVVLLAVAWAAGLLAVNSRYRGRVGYDQELNPVEQRLADTVRWALVVLAFGVPVLLLSLHRFSPHEHGTRSELVRPRFVQPPPPARLPPPTEAPKAKHGWDASLLLHILAGLGIALLVAAAVAAAVYLWRHLYRPPGAEPHGTYAAADDEEERLADAVASGRRALLGGDDARAAVIACYAAMEESLAASGVARKASDSPQDLLRRATAGGLLTGTAAGQQAALTALFREARYSTHPMDSSHRDRAAAALTGIAAGLEAHRAATAAGAETAS